MPNARLKPIVVNSCPACGSAMVEELIKGQIICRECGLVTGLEGKGEENKTRKSHKPYLESSDSPAIFFEDYFPEWQRLLKVSDSMQRNVALTLYNITKIVRVLKLPRPVLNKSIELYEALAVKQNFKGKRLNAMSAAIVYASCKILGVPCSLREVAKVSDEDQSKVFHCYTFVVERLEIPQTQDCSDESLNRLCKIMKIDALTWDIARKLINNIRQRMVTAGKNPYGYLAAVIYIASIITGKKRTQRELAEITRTTEATIRTRYKELIRRMQLVIGI
jgi:transcription initiation factor TFIIB